MACRCPKRYYEPCRPQPPLHLWLVPEIEFCIVASKCQCCVVATLFSIKSFSASTLNLSQISSSCCLVKLVELALRKSYCATPASVVIEVTNKYQDALHMTWQGFFEREVKWQISIPPQQLSTETLEDLFLGFEAFVYAELDEYSKPPWGLRMNLLTVETCSAQNDSFREVIFSISIGMSIYKHNMNSFFP